MKTKKQIRALLVDYPQSIHAKALKYGREEYDLLVEIRASNQATQAEFDVLSADYPAGVREGAHALVGYPEVLGLLSEDLELMVLLGEAYAKDPVQIAPARAHIDRGTGHAIRRE